MTLIKWWFSSKCIILCKKALLPVDSKVSIPNLKFFKILQISYLCPPCDYVHSILWCGAAPTCGFVCSFVRSFVLFLSSKNFIVQTTKLIIAWFTSTAKTNLDGRGPFTEDDLRWKTTFDRVFSILPEKDVYDSSPWQPQHNWPQTGNPISCLNRK